MDIYKKVKNYFLVNTNTSLMEDYIYYIDEEKKKLEQELKEIYNLNASVNYINPSFIFPHKFLIDRFNAYSKTYVNYKDIKMYNNYWMYVKYNKMKLLLKDLKKLNEEFSIHYDMLNKLEISNLETSNRLEEEKSKIRDCFNSNLSIIKNIEKSIKNSLIDKDNHFKIDTAGLEFERIKRKINKFIPNSFELEKKIKNIDIEEEYIGLIYILDVFFHSREGENYLLDIKEKMINININCINNEKYNPIPEINYIINSIEFINEYLPNWDNLSQEYQRLLDIKYEYLKKHPDEKEINNLKKDFNGYNVYIPLIKRDLDSIEKNDSISNIFYDFIDCFSVDEIYRNEFPSALSLLFAYYSNTLEKYFQYSINNENGYQEFLKIYKKANPIITTDMSRETFFYTLLYDAGYVKKLINLHREVIIEKGLTYPLLKGIKEITLNDSKLSKNILYLFSLDKNITISKDVKSFSIENLKNIESGNIIFQDGIEKINMRNVSFKDEISITIPKSVNYLDIDIVSSNINTLIFEDYDQSNLLYNPYFINSIISQIYNEKSNCFTLNNCDYYVSPNSNKTIKLVLKRNNENKEYVFKQIYIFYNKSIHDFDNKELWKQDLIDTARKKEYDIITGELHIKDRVEIITNISLNNITNKSISLPEYGPFLVKNEEEIRLLSEIVGAKVLDLGCGEGKSLEYLYQKGAKEVWGIEQSEEIREKAKNQLQKITDNFHVSSMNDDNFLPNDYFDYIIYIYKLGYKTDLKHLFQNVYKHLNDTGAFIISCPNLQNYYLEKMSDLVLNQIKYGPKNSNDIKKLIETINLEKQYYRVPTIINNARESNLYIDRAIEEKPTNDSPNTIIYKIKKLSK